MVVQRKLNGYGPSVSPSLRRCVGTLSITHYASALSCVYVGVYFPSLICNESLHMMRTSSQITHEYRDYRP